MSIDLELYKVFYEVVKYKNISKASEKMYITQSAVTQSIKKLEDSLGGMLFYRKSKGVELTEEGRNLYEYIKDNIEAMSNAENIFSNYVNLDKGKIRIGGGNSLISSLILESLMIFIKDYPNIQISINNGITDALIQKLSNGELDIVVLNLPYLGKINSNIEIIPLKKSNYSFFASKRYLKEHKLKDFSKVEDYTLILPKAPSNKRKILDDYAQKKGIEIKPTYEISSSSIMKKMVLNDIGIGFANTENLTDIMDEISIIKSIDIETQSGIAVLKKNMCNKATLELVKIIKEYYKKLLLRNYIFKQRKDIRMKDAYKELLYQDKKFIIEKLITYLQKEFGIEYLKHKIIDMNHNVADILVKKDSEIFKKYIDGKELLNFNIEELIDKRMFENKDEIIIIDMNFDDKLLNLEYLCDSLNYYYLSYSDTIKDKLSIFTNYIINKNIKK